MSSTSLAGSLGTAARLIAFATAYGLLAVTSMELRDSAALSTLYWPPAGLLLAALILAPTRRWPGWMALAASLHVAAGVVVAQRSLSIAVVFAAADLVLCGAVAALWRRAAGSAPDLAHPARALWFIGLTGVASIVTGRLLVALLDVLQPGVRTDCWYVWSLAAFAGCAVVTPLVLAWAGLQLRQLGEQNLRHLWLGLLAGFALLAGTTWVFNSSHAIAGHVWPAHGWPGHDWLVHSWPWMHLPRDQNLVAGQWQLDLIDPLYAPLIFLALLALNWGPPGTTLAVAGLALLCGSYTYSGLGPYADAGARSIPPLLALQIYLACAAVIGIVLASVRRKRVAVHGDAIDTAEGEGEDMHAGDDGKP